MEKDEKGGGVMSLYIDKVDGGGSEVKTELILINDSYEYQPWKTREYNGKLYYLYERKSTTSKSCVAVSDLDGSNFSVLSVAGTDSIHMDFHIVNDVIYWAYRNDTGRINVQLSFISINGGIRTDIQLTGDVFGENWNYASIVVDDDYAYILSSEYDELELYVFKVDLLTLSVETQLVDGAVQGQSTTIVQDDTYIYFVNYYYQSTSYKFTKILKSNISSITFATIACTSGYTEIENNLIYLLSGSITVYTIDLNGSIIGTSAASISYDQAGRHIDVISGVIYYGYEFDHDAIMFSIDTATGEFTIEVMYDGDASKDTKRPCISATNNVKALSYAIEFNSDNSDALAATYLTESSGPVLSWQRVN